MKRFIILFSIILLTLNNAWAANLSVGKSVPSFSIKTFDGQTITNSSAKGHILVIHLWATWCESCRKEMPALESFYKKHHKDGVDVVALSVDDKSDLNKVKAAVKEFSFIGAMEADSDIQKLGRIWRVPVTFVIDQNGILKKNGWEGDPIVDEELLEKIVAPLLTPPIVN
jgi:alkyl hydroperoxide reductase subunit AhpC